MAMKYNHLRLLQQLVDRGTPQQKIITYFIGEGYKEWEVLARISEYENQKAAAGTLKTLGEDKALPKIEARRGQSVFQSRFLLSLVAIVVVILILMGIMLVVL